jgi:hypothetical protein
MEAITLMVCRAAEAGLLSSFRNCTQLQRVSIYADDVVLFVKPSIQDLVTVKELLEVFGAASGLIINYNKTSATLIRGTIDDSERVASLLHCTISTFPIKYLGLQLSLGPLTRAQWQPVLDSATRIVSAWQKSLITRPGRLVLVKSVMAARLFHHLIIADAPAWFLEEIDRSLRGFLWAGKDKANGGQCLVAWHQVCKPREYVGLGVKNLLL